MKTRPFGPSRIKLPVIGQGTWLMENDPHAQVVQALRRGLELGMTHVDTAELYGHGEVERLVGEAIAGAREQVFLTSKVVPKNASRAGTITALERSLKNLKTDHLDLYLLHWPGSHPLEETVAAFEELEKSGKIRAWGLSNFDVDLMAQVEAIAGPGRIACNQVLYHLNERYIEHALIPWCAARNIAVVAYSPFGSGNFPSPESRGGQVLAQIASRHKATPHQVALSFLLRHPPLFAIPKASTPAHVEQNAAAADLNLSPEEIQTLDQAFPLGSEESGLPVI